MDKPICAEFVHFYRLRLKINPKTAKNVAEQNLCQRNHHADAYSWSHGHLIFTRVLGNTHNGE